MNKLLEKFKDFLYDSTDYILVLIIIAGVAGIIAWRLDILFAKDVKNNLSSSPIESNISKEENKNENREETSGKSKEVTDKSTQGEVVNVEIPEGSLPPSIATILFEKGVIEDKDDFLITARKMSLDVKFRPGMYEFKKDIHMEDIIKILAKQDVIEDTKEGSNKNEELNNEHSQNEVINIEIPEGSLPPSIANILFEKGVIKDTADFLKTAKKLNLDVKLRPGKYEIKKDMPIETVIKIVAKQKY